MEDRFFRYALLLSLALHAGLCLRLVMLPRGALSGRVPELVFSSAPRPTPRTEASLRESPPPPPLPPSMMETVRPRKEGTSGPEAAEGVLPKLQEGAMREALPGIMDRQPEKLKGVRVSREVSMPVLRSEKINTPAYATYYQTVRDRIRERAYTNYTRLSRGEVYLTFIITSDGKLSRLQVMEGRSTANDFLRKVGEDSVREAAPFPAFPKELNFPELTFNVQISFQFREE